MSSDSNENSIPPITADVTEAEIRMNVKDKLQLIDKEVRELYEFCVKAGYTPEQIELCATPMLAVETSVKRKSWFKRLGYLLGVVLLVFFFVYYEPAYYNICIYAKLASMKVLPYWDWRYIYDEFCFVKNPYYVEQKLTKKDCRENCKELKTIGVIEKTDANEMSDFLFSETPVIINDATDDWQARKDFSIEFLAKLYSENSILRNNEVCNFQTTIDGNVEFFHDMDVPNNWSQSHHSSP
ncbi:predicted protein [Nematostella vectensis]|uniref:Uncharacterized protein n=1 Tax=Nematostella vectensis TaxID=45351 RepID=A7RYM8_NEMVE|nr:predicted protein [Nematostella vectensis]|eukprot:XP_001635612.1 predicted protein [Nematostella vectensis]